MVDYEKSSTLWKAMTPLSYLDERTGLEPHSRRLISAASLVLANLLPVWLVARGHASMGDVFVVYWLENVVVGAFTVIRILSARGVGPANPSAKWPDVSSAFGRVFMVGFFVVHFGIFTVVHGVFTFMLAGAAGLTGSGRTWLLLVLSLFVSHAVSLAVNWFGQAERDEVAPQQAMMAPYSRIAVLHVAIMVVFVVLVGPGSFGGAADRASSLVGVLVLSGVKITLDLLLHLRERRSFGAVAGPEATPDRR